MEGACFLWRKSVGYIMDWVVRIDRTSCYTSGNSCCKGASCFKFGGYAKFPAGQLGVRWWLCVIELG